MPTLAELTKSFAVPDKITFIEGRQGMTAIRLSSDKGEAEIYLNGAHLTHWHPAGQDPVLWVSDRSYFENGKPIRGGVPICWPWFGPHETDESKPSHGLARISEWSVTKTDASEGVVSVTLSLSSDDQSKTIFEHDFELNYTVTLSDTLSFALTTRNTDTNAFTISEALHTYFGIASIPQIAVYGLEDTLYIDKVKDARRYKQNGAIKFTEETDRVYLDTTSPCIIEDPWAGRRITVNKSGSQSTVVWNPWIEKSARMPDFGDLEYKNMVCVETANAHDNAHEVAPGESKTMTVELSVE